MPGKSNSFKIFYAISIAWQLGFLIAFPIMGFGFLGIFLDSRLGIHVLTSIGFGIGAIIAGYETFSMLKPFLTGGKKKIT